MEVAVVSSVDLRAMREECSAKLKGILVLPPDQRGGALKTWIESAPTIGAKLQRANILQEILASMQNSQSGSAPPAS